MKIVMTGGGTGGHIYPALAIADKFVQNRAGTKVIYIGDKNCMESTIVPKAGYEFHDVPAEEVNRSNFLLLVKTGVKNIAGIYESREILKEFSPDAVIGTGGFVSFPVLYAAHTLGIPCYFHEQNAFPGLANKMLEKYASKVFLGFRSASGFFKYPEKHIVTGNPVRGAFFNLDREASRERLGIGRDQFVILSFGGSLGAGTINDVMYEVMKQINGENRLTMLFGTGKAYYSKVQEKIEEDKLEIHDNIRIMPYIDDMTDCLAAADLVVSRSGALTVAETCTAGRASVLIPSPNVTGNHQYYNAKEIADNGGAILIEDKDFDFDKMMEITVRLLNNPEEVREMAKKAKEMAAGDAAMSIYEHISADIDGKEQHE